MTRIVLASNNQSKLAELQSWLTHFNFQVIPQTEFSVPSPEETGLSFVENAIIKARHAAEHTGLPAIGDDSGLEVDALDGEPGIYSARYSESHATDKENYRKLLAEMSSVPEGERTARFQCVLAFLRHANDSTPIICHGHWDGHILFQPEGEQGFGYDPVFYVPTHKSSVANLSTEVKNHISHRGEALHKLVAKLRDLLIV